MSWRDEDLRIPILELFVSSRQSINIDIRDDVKNLRTTKILDPYYLSPDEIIERRVRKRSERSLNITRYRNLEAARKRLQRRNPEYRRKQNEYRKNRRKLQCESVTNQVQ